MAMRTITGLSIDGITFDGTNYILQEVTGLESPLLRVTRYNLPGGSGAFISNVLYGERSIRLKGIVNAPNGSRVTYLANRIALINALTYKRDNSNNIVPQVMTITLENGQVLTTNVYMDTPLQMGFSMDQVDFEEFQVTFVAADPNLYSSTQSSYNVSLPIGGGTAIPTPIPISLAPSSGGSVVANNPGSVTSQPVITLTAPLTSPYITNLRTGQFLQIGYTLNIGDASLVIDCTAQTIFQGSNNITGIQSSDSTFWGILSGNNTIGFSAAAGSGTAAITFYPTYIGV